MGDVIQAASGTSTVTSTARSLSRRRILVIEDESMVMMLLRDMLEDIGCVLAGSASRIEEATEKAKSLVFDVAILDVNLNGTRTFPIAEVLTERGIGFVFATGYGTASLPPAFAGTPVLQKPFSQQDLERALRAALT